MNRQLLRSAVYAAALVALLCLAASPAAAIPKSGSFKGQFGWYAVGTLFPIDETRLFWVGEFTGTFFNDNGSGVFHRASTKCPASNDIYDGVGHAQGYCVMTDADGDQAVAKWQCEGPAGQRCPGTFSWVSGTGKYAGITGESRFTGVFVTQSEGYATWDATYRLP